MGWCDFNEWCNVPLNLFSRLIELLLLVVCRCAATMALEIFRLQRPVVSFLVTSAEQGIPGVMFCKHVMLCTGLILYSCCIFLLENLLCFFISLYCLNKVKY